MRVVQLCLSITLLIALNFVTVAQPGTRTAIGTPNAPKHNQVVVEFPGHKYSLEIAVKPTTETVHGEERTTLAVFAYVSDTHFEPLLVDTKQIRLNFVVDRRPKSFILLPAKANTNSGADTKPQSLFELKDPELVKLISEGWQSTAQASMLVGRTPFTARLIKAKDFVPHNCKH